MNNEWLVVKHNYNDECPNIGISLSSRYQRKRLFKSARKYLQVYNDFSDSYVPFPYGFFWSTHEQERVFIPEETDDF